MRDRWDWSVVADSLPYLLDGLAVTVQAVLWGTLVAMVVGLGWTLLRRSHRRSIRWSSNAVLEFVRSTPLLVQLYFLYYVLLPAVGLGGSALLTGVLALGLHYATYTSEVYRSGIEGIGRGQWDAAKALNLSRSQTYRHVVLPQAIPPVIPALANYVIAMFKDTPLLAAISVVEVLLQALNYGSKHFRYLEPLTLVGLLYLALSLLAGTGARWLEGRLALRTE